MRFMILYPFKFLDCNLTFNVTSIRHTLWFYKDSFVSILGRRFMLDSFGDNDHLTSVYFYLAITEAHNKRTLHDDESFVCCRMAVPNKVTFEFYGFEVVVVHLGDQSHCIVTDWQLSKLFRKVDFFYVHS